MNTKFIRINSNLNVSIPPEINGNKIHRILNFGQSTLEDARYVLMLTILYDMSYGTFTDCDLLTTNDININPPKIGTGGQVVLHVVPHTGFELNNSSFTVLNADYNYEGEYLTLSNPTGNVSVSARAGHSYTVTVNCNEYCTLVSGSTKVLDRETAQYKFNFTTGYHFDDTSINVTNATLVSVVDNIVTITNPTGNVIISANAIIKVFTITHNTTHCTCTSGPSSVTYGSSATFIYNVDENYELLKGLITVVGGTLSSYSDNTLYITNIIDNVTITAPAQLIINYLCFTANTAGSTIAMTSSSGPAVTLEYSFDRAIWESFVVGTTTITLSNVGDKAYFRGTNIRFASGTNYYNKFTMTGSIAASGDITTILNMVGGKLDISDSSYTFCSLFSACASLTSSPQLISTTLSDSCYYSMFLGCSNLTSISTLPASTLTNYCYAYMFKWCTSLNVTLSLLATTVAIGCYSNMFYLCSSLSTAPNLPATTLYFKCYESMFKGCTSLTNVPAILPATSLEEYCYSNMFENCTSLVSPPTIEATTLNTNGNCLGMFAGCTSLTTTPVLHATTLSTHCYLAMFQGCTSLTTAPALPATTLANYCYEYMFYGCTSLTTAPALPATTLTEYCYYYMFTGCTSLTSVGSLSATTLKKYSYAYMFNGCTALVNAPTISATTLSSYCCLYMFLNCTSLTTVSTLPATTLAERCYALMFESCTSLTTAPALPATTLANYCYLQMFSGCTSLTTAPALPATTLALYCYSNMFNGCTALTTVTALPATTLAYNCYSGMFYNCIHLTTVPALPATTLVNNCYYLMFYNCTNLESLTVSFTDWNTSNSCTYYWVYGVKTFNKEFNAPTELSVIYDDSHIPSRWEKPTADDYFYLSANEANSTISVLTWKLSTSYVPNELILLYTSELNGSDTVWTLYNLNDTLTLTNVGDKLYFYGILKSLGALYWYYYFKMTGSISAGGDITTLLSGKGNITDLTNYSTYTFRGLFYNCTALTTAPILPSTTLKDYCYWKMFWGCTNLVTSPLLPATNLAQCCYNNMFKGCTSLVNTYKLPATTLSGYCYQEMFRDCTSLTIPPELPAITLTTLCYYLMFCGCTSLITVPGLPATTLASYCYCAMFSGCSNLEKLPQLYATTLYTSCYNEMFYNCTKIKISATYDETEYSNTYDFMTTPSSSYASKMFSGTGGTYTGTPTNKIYYTSNLIVKFVDYLCFISTVANSTVSMNSTVNAPSVLIEYSTDKLNWNTFTVGTTTITLSNIGDKVYFRGTNNTLASSGTEYNYFVMTGGITISGEITTLLNVEGDIKDLSTYGDYTFCNLFKDCSVLTVAPELISLTLKAHCYDSLFSGSGITTMATDSATTLADYCYANMYKNCTNLSTLTTLSIETLAVGCYKNMFHGCINILTAPTLSATTLVEDCYSNMFEGCSNLTTITVEFASWLYDETNIATTDWLKNVSDSGTFKCLSDLGTQETITRGDSYCPTNWTVINKSVSVNLNNGQWIDSGTTVSGNIVYKSDSGSYHVNSGKSTAIITITGYTEFTLYIRSYAESSYDYTEAFALDTTASRGSGKFTTKGKQSSTNYITCSYTNIDEGTHTIQIMYSKDSSQHSGDDRGYFYYIP